MERMWKYLAVLTVCSLISGCAVTTKPLTRDDIVKRIAADRTAMYRDQEPVKAPVSLEEAMARSVKYNLDHRLKLMEDALALRQVDLLTFDMLPRLVASAGYAERDSYNASSSMSVFTEQQSLVPSTSQDKRYENADLTLAWNILDFGVSYFQAKQQADRALIMKERRRKVVHNIMQQIRQAYWLALGAQQLEVKFDPLLLEVDKALQDIKRIDSEKLRAPLETLTYRKTLLEIIRQLESFRDELAQAKPRLAALMNIPPGQSFRLALPSSLEIPAFSGTLETMETEALSLRPELKEADYNERISVNETRKAITRMFPGIELSVGGHYNSNSFLVNQSWIEGGARITMNLLNLLSGPSQYKITKGQTEVVQIQRLALSMAVLTQVHISYREFFNRKRQYELAEQLQEVDARIHEQTMNQADSGAQSRLNEIRAATAALMAEYRRYQNYAALQNAYGQMIATLGTDPLPETVSGHDINTMAQAIKSFIDPGHASDQPTATRKEIRTPPADNNLAAFRSLPSPTKEPENPVLTVSPAAAENPQSKKKRSPLPEGITSSPDTAPLGDPKKPRGRGKYSVQLVSYQDNMKAVQFCDQVKPLGYHTRIATSDTPNQGRWFTVVVDGFDTRREAKEAAEVLSNRIGIQYLVRPIP